MEYSGLFELEKRLDASLESKRSLVVIGPGAIGKTGRIKAWVKKKQLNAYNAVEGFIDPYQNDTAEGVLLLDHPMPMVMHYPEYIPQILEDRDALANKIYEYLGVKPEILFSVVVFSEYGDNVEAVQSLFSQFDGKEDWDVVRIDYDKREQVAFFIKEDEEAIERLSSNEGKKDFDESPDDLAQFLPKDMMPEREDIISKTKQEKDFLKYLMDCEQFDTKPGIIEGQKCPGLSSCRLSQALVHLFSGRGSAEENLKELLDRHNELSWNPRIRQMCALYKEFMA